MYINVSEVEVEGNFTVYSNVWKVQCEENVTLFIEMFFGTGRGKYYCVQRFVSDVRVKKILLLSMKYE